MYCGSLTNIVQYLKWDYPGITNSDTKIVTKCIIQVISAVLLNYSMASSAGTSSEASKFSMKLTSSGSDLTYNDSHQSTPLKPFIPTGCPEGKGTTNMMTSSGAVSPGAGSFSTTPGFEFVGMPQPSSVITDAEGMHVDAMPGVETPKIPVPTKYYTLNSPRHSHSSRGRPLSATHKHGSSRSTSKASGGTTKSMQMELAAMRSRLERSEILNETLTHKVREFEMAWDHQSTIHSHESGRFQAQVKHVADIATAQQRIAEAEAEEARKVKEQAREVERAWEYQKSVHDYETQRMQSQVKHVADIASTAQTAAQAEADALDKQ